jgi:flagellar basal-body rod protein FlgG
VNSNGYRLDVDFDVPEGTTGLRISPDGFVYGSGNSGTRELGRISLAHFFNPQGLDAAGNNLYLQTPASGPAVYGYPGENGFGRVLSGSLETSNVSVIREMTDMIINQRGMEVNLKATQTHDSMFLTLINMKR